jgi:hypothetical protein
MLIAREKRKTNIAEYILYMWQVEDLIRAYQFNINEIEEHLISQYAQSAKVKNDVRDWFADLILMMHQEGIRKKGHLSFLKTLMDEITDLHIRLLNLEGQHEYQQAYHHAASYLDDFRKRTSDYDAGDIESSLNALYGLLLLRLKKQQVSRETELAMASFSKLMALLSHIFLQVERGEREI